MTLRKIEFEDCVRVEDNIYMIDRNINLLYRMSIKNGTVEIVSSMPEEDVFSSRLGAKIIYNGGNLYFAPMNAKKIWKWNISSGKWKGFERKHIENWTMQGDMFQAVLHNNKIFFIGCLYPAIVILDIDTEELTYIEEPYKHINTIAKEEKDACFRTDYVQIENVIYIASCVSNEVLRFNLDSLEYDFLSVGEKDFKYSGIGFDGNIFYLAPRKTSPIVIWDGDNKCSSIELPDIYKKKKDNAIFAGVLYDSEKVIFPSCFWDKTLILKKKEKELYPKIEDNSYYFYKQIDNETLAALKKPNQFCVRYQNQEYCYEMEIEKKIVYNYLKDYQCNTCFKSPYRENKDIDIKMFLSAIE